MLLVFVTAILAVCGAAKLDRNYLPPITAKTAGGTAESLLAPVERSNIPTGSYVNDEQGVVVDAVAPGTRASGEIPTGLGASRISYGSTNSKVGDAAFTSQEFGSNIPTRIAPGFASIIGVNDIKGGNNLRIAPGVEATIDKNTPNNDKSHANTVKFANEISKEKYSFGYETDNGIFVGENGVARDGIEANGGYSYEGKDGKVYSVSYTADKDGYRPKGNHLPTPPPIPIEIVKSLEDNARDEAKGIVDDGSYNAQKYNIQNDYSSNNDSNNKHSPSTNGDASFIVSHGKYASQSNSGIREVNSQTPEFIHTQNSYEYSAPALNRHVFENKHFGYGVKQNAVPSHSGFKSPYGSYNTAFPSLNNGVSLPHVGDSFATAVASTDSNVDNQKLIKSQSDLIRTPISSLSNTAYSSATATGSGSASASASTAPNHAIFDTEYNPLHIGTFGENEQDSKFEKGSSKSESVKATPSYPTFTSASAIVSGNQANIVKADSQNGNFNEKSTPTYKQHYNLRVPPAYATSGLPSVTPTKVPALELSTPFEPNESSEIGSSATDLLISKPQSTLSPSVQQFSQIDSTSTSQNKPYGSQSPQISNDQRVSNYASFGPSTINSVHKQQSSVNSYFYNQPARPFLTPVTGFESANIASGPIADSLSSVPLHYTSQTPKNWLNIPSTDSESSTTFPQFGKIEGSKSTSYFNGITQASIAPFAPTLSTPYNSFESHSQQFETKPNTQFYSKTFKQSQIDITRNKPALIHNPDRSVGQKPAVQSLLGSVEEINSQTHDSQLHQGTIYEYNKPSTVKSFSSSLQQNPVFKFNQKQPEKPSFSLAQAFNSNAESKVDETIGTQIRTGGTKLEVNSPVNLNTKHSPQQTQGTIYHYNKPSATIFSNKETSKLSGLQLIDRSDTYLTNQNEKLNTVQKGVDSSLFQTSTSSSPGSQFEKQLQPGSGASLGAVSQIKPQSQYDSQAFGSQSVSGSFQSTQKGSSLSQFGQNTGIKDQSAQQITNFGQQPFDSSQSTSSSFSQNTFESTSGSQFGQNLQSNAGIKGKSGNQNAQSSQPLTGNLQSVVKSSSSVPQFGQTTGIKGQSVQQTTNFGQKPFSSYQSTGSSFSPNTFGSTSGSQFGQNLQPNAGTKGKLGTQNAQNSQLVTKVESSQTLTGNLQSVVKSSSSVPQFGQTTDIKSQSVQQTTNSVQQPFGSSQTGSSFSQNTFGSTSGSQFGQNLHPDAGTKGKSGTQNAQSSQPLTGNLQSLVKSSSSVSQFGQTTGIKGQSAQQTTNFGQQPFGSSQTTGSSFSQNTFGSTSGSQFGQNLQPNAGTKGKSGTQNAQSSQPLTGNLHSVVKSSSSVPQFGQTSGIKGQYAQQTTNFGQQPFGSSQTGSSFSQNTLGSTSGSQFIQNLQPNAITKGKLATQNAQNSEFVTKVESSQPLTGNLQSLVKSSSSVSQFGQTTGIKGQSAQQTTNFGQQPFSSSQTTGSSFSQNTFGSTSGSQFGQNLQPNAGTKGKSGTQNAQSSQPLTGNLHSVVKSSSSVPQFGQTSGIKGQYAQQTTNFGQQPFGSSQTGSSFSQNTLGSTSGSQFIQNLQPNAITKGKLGTQNAQNSEFVTKVENSQTLTGNLQSVVKSSSSIPQFGQTSGIKGQSAQQTTNLGQQPFGSSQTTGSFFSQNTFGSTSGSQFGQNLQPNAGTKGKSGTQNAQSSQPLTGNLQSVVKSSSSVPQFGQTSDIKGQSAQQTTNFGQQLFGSSQTSGSSFPQNAFGSTSGSQFGQNLQSNAGTKGKSGTQNAQSSQQLIGNLQSLVKSSSSVSQFGQTTGLKGQSVPQTTSNFGQKPFGSYQPTGSSFSQNTVGSTSGSQFGQNLQSNTGSKGNSDTQNVPNSQFVRKVGSLQPLTGTFQSAIKGSSSASQFRQTSGTKGQSAQQTTNFGQQPFGSSQTSGSSFPQNAFGSTSGSQFGQNLQSNAGTKGKSGTQNAQSSQQLIGNLSLVKSSSSVSQFGQTTGLKGQSVPQTTSNFGQKPFGSYQPTGSSFSQNTVGSTSGSQFGQNLQSNTGTKGKSGTQNAQSSQPLTGNLQSVVKSSSSVPKFGQTSDIKGQSTQQTTNFGQQPFGSSQTSGSSFPQNAFGSTSGSQFGQNLQFNAGTKGKSGTQNAQNSQQLIGNLQSLVKSSSSVSQFGQTTGLKGQSVPQTTSNFGQKPFGSYQPTGSSFSQNTFGSTSGSQFGQNLQSNTGTKGKSDTQNVPNSQFVRKVGSLQPLTGTFQSAIRGSSFASQFGQTSGIKGQSAQQTTNFGQQPFGSSQTSGSSFPQNAFGSTSGSQFGQNLQSNAGTKGKSGTQNAQSSQQLIGNLSLVKSSSSVSQFGQTTGLKGQSVPQTTSNFGQKPFGSYQPTGSSFSQNTVGSTSGSQFGQNLQSNTGTKGKSGTQNAQSSQPLTGNLQSVVKSSSSVPKFGQTSDIKGQSAQQTTNFGQQPFGSSQTSGSSFPQNAFGSTSGSQFGQNLQSNAGTKGKSGTQNAQNSQFITKVENSQPLTGNLQTLVKSSPSVSQFGQTSGIKGQSAQQTTNFGQQPFGSSQTTGSSFSQNTFSSTSGSQFGQNLQSNAGTKGKSGTQNAQNSQFITKVENSQPLTGNLQTLVKSSPSVSQFGQTIGINGQSAQQTTNFGQQPFGSSQTGSSFSQNTFGSTSGSQFAQNLQSNAGTKGKSDTQNAQSSQPLTGNLQSVVKSSSSVPQFGQTTGIKGQSVQQTTNFGQKPFSSYQTTGSSFSQNTFGSTSGSQFGLTNDSINSQNRQLSDSSKGSHVSKSSQTSQFNTKLNKPFVNTQAPVLSVYEYTSGQRPQNTASAFASTNLESNGDIIADRISNNQFTYFGKLESETIKPFVNSYTNQDSSSKFGYKVSNPLNLDSFGHRQSSSQSFASSAIHHNTKSQVIPATQISIDQLRAAAANSKSKLNNFNEKSSQSVDTQLNEESLKPTNNPIFGLRSQDRTKFSNVSTAHTLTSNYEKKPDTFVGNKEVFAERRDPPKFDIKTGYHY